MDYLIAALGLVIVVITIIVITSTLRRQRRREDRAADVERHNDERSEALLYQVYQARAELESTAGRLSERESRLDAREDHLEEKAVALGRRRDELDQREKLLGERAAALDEGLAKVNATLEQVAGLSVEQAREQLISQVRDQAIAQGQHEARMIEDEATALAERRARHIVATAIERVAVPQSTQAVVTSVELPSEDMKGRIIGREGRNIRVFEQITGVTVMIDDTPGSVLLSCFDPVRREIARLTLTTLVEDGRIHPSSIEETYERACEQVEQSCLRAAEEAIEAAGLVGVAPGLLPTIGALNYRTSYGQNVLEHSVECARIAGALATELGVEEAICRRAAFFHDIGKAVITHGEGSHASEGAELLRRFGEDEVVVHAAAAHHNEVPVETIEDLITQSADAISGARPGARRESFESYIHRLERLEEIAMAKPGVDRAFAIQAGREIRVMVLPDEVNDDATRALAREIAADVERELVYPGRIKVTVIRESRATEMA